MAETIDLGPLWMQRDGQQALVKLTDPNAVTLEIPQDFESEIRSKLEHVVADQVQVEADLEDLPALNSRQLGMLLVLQKVCCGDQPLKLNGVSDTVKRTLELTRVDRFFNCA